MSSTRQTPRRLPYSKTDSTSGTRTAAWRVDADVVEHAFRDIVAIRQRGFAAAFDVRD